jgi:hypothetical protein
MSDLQLGICRSCATSCGERIKERVGQGSKPLGAVPRNQKRRKLKGLAAFDFARLRALPPCQHCVNKSRIQSLCVLRAIGSIFLRGEGRRDSAEPYQRRRQGHVDEGSHPRPTAPERRREIRECWFLGHVSHAPRAVIMPPSLSRRRARGIARHSHRRARFAVPPCCSVGRLRSTADGTRSRTAD